MSTNPYDPVTTTDCSQLTEDEWGLNLPNVRYYSYRPSRLKSICNFIRDRFRLLMVIGCVIVLGVVLISIIAVAAQKSNGRKPSDEDRKKRWEDPEFGLTFYPKPADGSTVIEYVLSNAEQNPIYKSLKNVTDVYKMQHQLRAPYTECDAMNNPPNRICRLSNTHFGDECVIYKHWGYPHAMPCIFLQLNLPENVTIEPIPRSSFLWPVAEFVMKHHNDSAYVPVTCQGKTSKDLLILGVHGFDKANDEPIQYSPPDGFPSFFYRPRNMSLPFIKPAMMIRLTSLKDDVMVHIECTAWGQLKKDGHIMLNHKLLKTSFAVYIKT